MTEFEFTLRYRKLYQYFHPGKEPDEVQIERYFDHLKFILLPQFEKICRQIEEENSTREFNYLNLVKFSKDWLKTTNTAVSRRQYEEANAGECAACNNTGWCPVWVESGLYPHEAVAYCLCKKGQYLKNHGRGDIKQATQVECQSAAQGVPF